MKKMGEDGRRRYGSISFDMDTLEFYLSTAEDWHTGPLAADIAEHSYINLLPKILDICDKRNIKATFFIIGKHARSTKSRRAIRSISDSGHEVANHTLNHYKDFSSLPLQEIEYEIDTAESILSDITGGPVKGFRAPGYVINRDVLSILISKGYQYDSSLLPSILYNAGKLCYQLLSPRGDFYTQSFSLCFAPPTPFYADTADPRSGTADNRMLVIPVTVVPFIRIPFVSSIFSFLGYRFITSCYRFVRLSHHVLNFNIHDAEFLDQSDLDATGLGERRDTFINAILMKPLLKRRLLFDRLITSFQGDYRLVPLRELASLITPDLPVKKIR